jgi:hypothetical protein
MPLSRPDPRLFRWRNRYTIEGTAIVSIESAAQSSWQPIWRLPSRSISSIARRVLDREADV